MNPFTLAILALLAWTRQDDPFLAGYATAILERDFAAPGARVRVQDGVILLDSEEIQEKDRPKIVAALMRIRGVRDVVIAPRGDGARAPSARPDATPLTGGGWTLFSDERLFSPLLADPRWPRFSLSYQYFRHSSALGLRDMGSASLGEQFALASYQSEEIGRFSLGLQPGIHALFNLDAPSMDLVNADYRLGIPLDYRFGIFSAEARVVHQSSHLGDEFLLNTPIQRINLSFETVEVKLSLEWAQLRFYGGGGRFLHSDPGDFQPWTAQAGMEYASPLLLLNDSVRPVFALDLQAREETRWTPDVSVRVGIEVASPGASRRRIQLLLEYFHGRNPNGQFFRERLESFGIGLHVYF